MSQVGRRQAFQPSPIGYPSSGMISAPRARLSAPGSCRSLYPLLLTNLLVKPSFRFSLFPALDGKLLRVEFLLPCTGLNAASAATSTAAGPPTTTVASNPSTGASSISVATPPTPIPPLSSATTHTRPSKRANSGTLQPPQPTTASIPTMSSPSPAQSSPPGPRTTPSTPNSSRREIR